MATINPSGYKNLTVTTTAATTFNTTGVTTITFPTGTTSLKKTHYAPLMQGYYPTATGIDSITYVLPYSNDGTTSISWKARRIDIRSEAVGTSAASTFHVKYYTGTSFFTITQFTGNVNSALMSLAATSYETNTTSVTTTALASGTKLKVDLISLNAGHGPFFIGVLFEEA